MRTLPRGLALLLVLALLLGQGLESLHRHGDEVPVGFAWTASDCRDHTTRPHLEPAGPTPEVCLTCALFTQASAPAGEAPPLVGYTTSTAVVPGPVAAPRAPLVSTSRGRAPPSSSC